jgi:hypothetical protein
VSAGIGQAGEDIRAGDAVCFGDNGLVMRMRTVGHAPLALVLDYKRAIAKAMPLTDVAAELMLRNYSKIIVHGPIKPEDVAKERAKAEAIGFMWEVEP